MINWKADLIAAHIKSEQIKLTKKNVEKKLKNSEIISFQIFLWFHVFHCSKLVWFRVGCVTQLYRSILSNDIDDVRLKLRNQNIPDIQINKTIASRIFLKTYQSNSIQLAKFFIVEKQAALTQHFAKRMKKLYMKRHNRPGFEQKLEIVHLLESYTGIVAWRDQNLQAVRENKRSNGDRNFWHFAFIFTFF